MADPHEDPAAGRPVRWPIYLVVGLVVVAVLTRLVLLVGIFQEDELPAAGASEAKEGEQWSFQELFTFLKGRGVPLAIYTTKQNAPGGPVVSVCPEDHWAGRAARLVHIQRRPSAVEAHAAAPGGEDGFAWGRFAFTGEKDLLAVIRKALHN